MLKKSLPFLALAACFFPAGSDGAEIPSKHLDFFEKRIRPVLAEKCYQCHAADAEKIKGGLLLDTREAALKGGDTGPAVVPGKPGESLLLEAIAYHDEDTAMPPKERLPERVVLDFKQWIAMGAPDPRKADARQAAAMETGINLEEARKFWAFQPPVNVTAPEVRRSDWPRGEVDRFLLARLEAEGLDPVADADRATLLRRAYFDLIGLPPTPEELDEFLADSSNDTFERVVDRLLASPRFGERWGRHWMDVARYGESTGMERNFTYPEAWRYRDYVIASFNDDLPYDRFLREQIAGDLLPAADQATRDRLTVATGFLALGPKSLNERDRKQFQMDVVDEQLDVVGRGVLGLTVSCARCHDHKFDPVSMHDYYALAGFFTSTEVFFGTKKGNGNRQPSTLMPIGERSTAKATALKAHQQEVALVSRKLASKQKNYKKMEARYKKAKKKPAEMKAMAEEMDEIKVELKELREAAPEPPGYAMGVKDAAAPAHAALLLRGDPNESGGEVPRRFLAVLDPGEELAVSADQSGRLQLAEWLCEDESRLAARVMVNRIWQKLFGRGLVRTVDNFGEQGGRPSHPALLDHLALRFVEDGWSVKKIIRDLVLSRAYGLSSEHLDANYAADPDNILVWRMNRRRLDAEAMRDAVLAASGRLDLAPPKRSVVAGMGSKNVGRDRKDLDLLKAAHAGKRSVYLPIVRNIVPEFLQNFDFAEPSILVGQRNVTTVPTQALYLMNSEFILEEARATAARVLESGAEREDRLDLLYRLTLARLPDQSERAAASGFLDQMGVGAAESGREDPRLDAWSLLGQSILASAEFRTLN